MRRGDSWFERIVSILAQVAIPIAIVLIGALISRSVATMDVGQKYVELAVTMLKADNIDEELRDWAVGILQEYAPIPLNPETVRRLRTGDVDLFSCQDECSAWGDTRWLNGSYYQTCAQYDCDACLEWSTPIYSPQGQPQPESP